MIVRFHDGTSTGLALFARDGAGMPNFGNTTTLEWKGRINDDGTWQIVSRLGEDLGVSTTGANNRGQIAVWGRLP
jgi:hypothetical protein